jgi:hypothetical protein
MKNETCSLLKAVRIITIKCEVTTKSKTIYIIIIIYYYLLLLLLLIIICQRISRA